MEVTVEHLGSVQFEIRARGHFLASDQPIEDGGFDEGMTPPELLLAALASCWAILYRPRRTPRAKPARGVGAAAGWSIARMVYRSHPVAKGRRQGWGTRRESSKSHGD